MPRFREIFRAGADAHCVLSPDRHGRCLQETQHMELVDGLREIPSVEVCWIDARDRTVNGLLLADFFDFS